jgi:Xaa-Pro aminopeptidase
MNIIDDASHKERDYRWQRVRTLMDEKGLDGLLVFGSDSPLAVGADQYLTNDRPGQHIVFPRLGKMVCMVPSTQFIAQHLISVERGEETWAEDLRVGMGGTTVVSVLKEEGLENKRIGTVGLGALGTSYHREGWVPYQTWLPIKEALPNTTLQDVTFEFVVLMLERSARDIACLRRAAESAEEACRAVIAATHAGATETDVYSVGMYTLLKSGAYATWMILTSGDDNFSWGPPTWTYRAQAPRILKEGDIVMLEMFPHYGGMEAQIQLAVAIGTIHPDHERCARAARQSYEAGLAAIRPGALFGDVCDAMEQPVRDIGGWHLTPMVHTINPLSHTSQRALGIEKHVPEIARRYAGVRGRERMGGDFELKPGMCLELEPNAHLGRRRVNIGGTVVVTGTGVEELNKTPNNLQRVP